MKKILLTTLTCLSFNSLSSYEPLDLRDYVLEKMDESADKCEYIELNMPSNCINNAIWNYHKGRIDALSDVVFWIDFGNGPCTSD